MNPEVLEELGYRPGRELLEAQVLAAMMIVPAWVKLCDLQTTDFTGKNQRIYGAIVTLFEDGGDTDGASVWAEVGGGRDFAEHISSVLLTIPTGFNFPHYQEKLKKKLLE